MEYFQNLYNSFVSIVGEGTCTDDEIKKYIQWGNGNIEQQSKQSNSQKKNANAKQKQQTTLTGKMSQSQPVAESRQNNNLQQKQVSNDNENQIKNKQQQQLVTKKLDFSEKEFDKYDDEEDGNDDDEYKIQIKPKVVNAFQKMQEGSRKMRDIDKMIEQMKEDIKKPVSSIVERKFTISQDEQNNNYDISNSMHQNNSSSMNNNMNINLDYHPSMLHKPTIDESQRTQIIYLFLDCQTNFEISNLFQFQKQRVPQHFNSKYPKQDTSPEQQLENFNQEQNKRKSHVNINQSQGLTSQQLINSEFINIQDFEQDTQIVKEQQNEFEAIMNNFKFSNQDKQNKNKEPTNYSQVITQKNIPSFKQKQVKDQTQKENIQQDNQIEQVASNKKTVNYESFEQGLKNLQKGENQTLQFPCYLGQFTLTGHALTSSRCDMKKGKKQFIFNMKQYIDKNNF